MDWLTALAALIGCLIINVTSSIPQDHFAMTLIPALIRQSQADALTFQHDEAISTIDAALRFDPDNPLLYVERGQRIMLVYEWDRALADFNHALALDPGYADAYYYRGVLFASVPEADAARPLALADFERFLELAPHSDHASHAARYIAQLQAQ